MDLTDEEKLLEQRIILQGPTKNWPGICDTNASTVTSSKEFLSPGQLVWAKINRNSRMWPALVVRAEDFKLLPTKPGNTLLYWLGDERISPVSDKYIEDFEKNAHKYGVTKKAPKKVLAGFVQAVKIIAERRGLSSQKWSDDSALLWAKCNIDGTSSKTLLSSKQRLPATPSKKRNPKQGDVPATPVKKAKSFDLHVPDRIVKRLENIWKQHEKAEEKRSAEEESKREEKQEKKSDELYKKRVENCDFVVVEGSSHLCVSCGSKFKDTLVTKHPWLKGYLCSRCQDSIEKIIVYWSKDGFNFRCEECGSNKGLLVCPVPACARIFCRPCSPHSTAYLCYVCEASAGTNSSISYASIRTDWKFKVYDAFFSFGRELAFKPKLRVLSLFDGIGTGLLVLDQLGLEVEKYYASEVDSSAIAIVNAHYPGRVTHLGDIAQISQEVLSSLGPINLLIGGSPCNQLSRVNATAKGLLNVEGSGVLFFDFARILRYLKTHSNHCVFWLFENVSSMRKDYRAIISRSLECEAAVWNAADYSPQRRTRLFWGNVPGLYTGMKREPSPQPLSDVLTPGCYRETDFEIINTITTNSNSQFQGRTGEMPVKVHGAGEKLWITEIERIFGFPTHYTDVGNFSLTCRSELLGRAWSVPVLKKMLKPLAHFFSTKDSQS